jgi:hypothetical protein
MNQTAKYWRAPIAKTVRFTVAGVEAKARQKAICFKQFNSLTVRILHVLRTVVKGLSATSDEKCCGLKMAVNFNERVT